MKGSKKKEGPPRRNPGGGLGAIPGPEFAMKPSHCACWGTRGRGALGRETRDRSVTGGLVFWFERIEEEMDPPGPGPERVWAQFRVRNLRCQPPSVRRRARGQSLRHGREIRNRSVTGGLVFWFERIEEERDPLRPVPGKGWAQFPSRRLRWPSPLCARARTGPVAAPRRETRRPLQGVMGRLDTGMTAECASLPTAQDKI
jgi:hypothetical protein